MIKTVVYKSNVPDSVITKVCNMLGDRFINVERIKGDWHLTFKEMLQGDKDKKVQHTTHANRN